jgi:hypothetical protein
MLILVIFAYLIILVFECIPLFKKKDIGKIILYLTLGILSMAISMLLTLGVNLPSPANFLKNVVEMIFGKQ